MPPITTRIDETDRGIPRPCIQRTSGAASAAINSEITSGIVMTAKWPRVQAMASPAALMTRNRHDQAAARSRPHGTWARLKLDGPVAIGSTRSWRRSARSWAHWRASWPASRRAPSSC